MPLRRPPPELRWAADAPPPVRASELPFSRLRHYFDALKKQSTRNWKTGCTKRLLQGVDRTSPDVSVLVKLMQPPLDANRVFGIRQADLIKIFREFVAASEAEELAQWRSGSSQEAGDFYSMAKKAIYFKRCRVTESGDSNVTLAEIDAVLDKLSHVTRLNVDEADDDAAAQQPSQAASQPSTQSQRGPIGPADKRPGAKPPTAKRQRANILRDIMQKLTADEMVALTRIILRDSVSPGYSYGSFLRDFHEDARRVYDCTKNVEVVCRECGDPAQRSLIAGISLGVHFSLQRCSPAPRWEKVLTALKGEDFVIENKLDGWRVAVHCKDPKDPSSIKYFTRSDPTGGNTGVDFNLFTPAVQQQLARGGVILDGEMLIWNRVKQAFEDFYCFKVVLTAIKTQCSPDFVLEYKGQEETERGSARVDELEVVYVAFDIVMDEGQSCMDLPQSARYEKLRTAVAAAPRVGVELPGSSIRARIVALLPDAPEPPLPDFEPSKDWSRTANNRDDIQRSCQRVQEEQWEGIVLKRLSAPYHFGLPPTKELAWWKWKPDFEQYEHDIDVLVVGGMYGTKGRGGALSRFVVALAAPKDSQPGDPTFWTLTRVGGGYTTMQRDQLNAALAPLLVPSHTERGVRSVPMWLKAVTTVSKDDYPDVWVRTPEKAPVVEIIGDVRVLTSKSYATGQSIRFPRFYLPNHNRTARQGKPMRIRDPADKNFREVTSVSEFRDLIDREGKIRTRPPPEGSRAARGKRPSAPRKTTLDPRFLLSCGDVTVRSDVLKGRMVYVLPDTWASWEERQKLHEAASSLGGAPTLNLLASSCKTELVVAGSLVGAPPSAAGPNEQRALRVAAQRLAAHARHNGTDMDALHAAWLLDCARVQALLPPRPRDYAHLSDKTLLALARQPGFDMFGTELAPAEAHDAADFRAMLEMFVPTAVHMWQKRLEVAATAREGLSVPRVPELSRADKRAAAREVAAAAGLGGELTLAFFSVAALAAPCRAESDAAAAPEAVPPAWKLLLAQRARRFVELGELDAPTTDDASCPDVVVLLPSGGEDVLRAVLPDARGAPLRGVAAAALRDRMAHWTPDALVRALHAACPFLPMLEKLAAALASGATELAAAAAALGGAAPPDDLGVCAPQLGLPVGASGKALRDWVLGLPWETVGVDSRDLKARAKPPKAERAQKSAKAPSKRGRSRPTTPARASRSTGAAAQCRRSHAPADDGSERPAKRAATAASDDATHPEERLDDPWQDDMQLDDLQQQPQQHQQQQQEQQQQPKQEQKDISDTAAQMSAPEAAAPGEAAPASPRGGGRRAIWLSDSDDDDAVVVLPGSQAPAGVSQTAAAVAPLSPVGVSQTAAAVAPLSPAGVSQTTAAVAQPSPALRPTAAPAAQDAQTQPGGGLSYRELRDKLLADSDSD